MKKFLLLLTLFTLGLSLWANETTINSVETLKRFMQEGQKSGYFPKTIPIGFPIQEKKLMAIDLDFRRVIHWNMNTRCPNNEDQIILALGEENRAIVCNRGDTAGILGSGDDWIKDATGNDIYYPGAGNDTIDVGSGNDILIFEEGWGHDTVTMSSHTVDTSKIMGYDGSYPWDYTDFIIFGASVKRSDIVWIDATLYNLKTGDTIKMNTKSVNILFASEKRQDPMYLPTRITLQLTDLAGESMVKSGDLLYIAKGNEGLQVVDTKDPKMLWLLSTVVLPGRALSVLVKDKVAYVAQGDFYLEGKRGWVSIVDLHDPSQPNVLATLKFGTTIKNVVVHNNMLYVPSTHDTIKEKRHLYSYDISNKSAPKLRSKLKLNDTISSLVYFNERLYYVSRFNYLKAFDLSTPSQPKAIRPTGLQEEKAVGLVVKNNLLMVTQKDLKITFYQGASNAALEYRCDFKTIANAQGYGYMAANAIVVNDDLMFKAESKYGISVSRISTCTHVTHFSLEEGNRSWITNLMMVGENLVSFKEVPKAEIYSLKKEKLYRVHSPLKREEIKSPRPLSQDQLQTALYKAALHGNSTEVKHLLVLGANPNIKGHERTTPIEMAARVGETAVLEALLKGGGKPTRKAMMLAALTKKEEAMKLLERYGVPMRVKDREGCTTLHYIAQDGSLEMVKYIISKGVPYNTTCRKGETPLTWANYGNNCEVINYLQGLYPKAYKHQVNKVCAERKVKAAEARAQQEKALAERKKYEKIIDGKAFYFEPIKIKVKVKQKKDRLNLKMMIQNPMYTEDQAKRWNKPLHYVTHVMVTVKNDLLFDATLTPRISKNPLFKAKFIYARTLRVKPLAYAKDNMGFSAKQAANRPRGVASEKYTVDKSIDYSITKATAWRAKTIAEAIKAFYGGVQFDAGDFEIKMPKVAANGGNIPISITSNLDLESILVLSEGNPKKALIAFHIPKGQKLDYHFRFKLKEAGVHQVVVVAKGRNGKYFVSRHSFELAGPSTCDGS